MIHGLSGRAALVGTEKGLFLAHSVSGKALVEPAGGANTGKVLHIIDLPGSGS
jgi:hypothetical protein